MGINIFTYDMHALNQKLVKCALNANKHNLYREIRKYPFKPRKGFRRIENLPYKLLIEEIINLAKIFPQLSNFILSIWYNSETNLREKVFEELTNLGYKVEPLQFDHKGVKWKKLKDQDILCQENKTFFAPNGVLIDNYDPTDVALMSILNGWFDNKLEVLTNKSITVSDLLLSNNEPAHTFSDVKEVLKLTDDYAETVDEEEHKVELETKVEEETKVELEANEDKEHEDEEETEVGASTMEEIKEYSNLDKNQRIINISENFEDLEKHNLKYEELKKKFLEEVKEIYNSVEKDIYNSGLDMNSELYKDLNELKIKLVKERNKMYDDLSKFANYINSKYSLKIEFGNYENDKININALKDRMRKAKAILDTVLRTTQMKLNGIVDDLANEEKESILENLNNIENKISEFKIERFEEIFENIDEAIHLAEEIKKENDISFLSKEFSRGKTEYLYNKIQKYINNNAEAEDRFAFFYAACKDLEACTFIENNIELYIDDLIEGIDKLALQYGDGFYISLIEDVDLESQLIKSHVGKVYLILLSILLSIQNAGESSITYLWNIKDELNDYTSIKKLIENILIKKEKLITNFNDSDLKDKLENIQKYFSKESGKYTKNYSVKHKVLKDLLNSGIYPELDEQFTFIKNAKTNEQLTQIKNKLNDEVFSIELYEEKSKDHNIDSHNEEFIRKSCLKEIQEIKSKLLTIIELKSEEHLSSEQSSTIEIEKELSKIKELNPALSVITAKIINCMNRNEGSYALEEIDLNDTVEEIFLNSSFFAMNFSNICLELVNHKPDVSNILDIIIKDADNSKDYKTIIETLIKNSNYTNAYSIKKAYNDNEINIDPTSDKTYKEIVEIENRLIEKKFTINPLYYYYKDNHRYGLALKFISEDEINQKELEKLTSKEIQDILNDFKKKSLDLKQYFFNYKDNFQKDTYLIINNGLNICERVSDEMLENKIDITREIIKEIEYLKINNDSNENLKVLIEKYEEPNESKSLTEEYLNLPLDTIREYLENENYNSLGLTKKTLEEIKDSRIQDILTLIEKWNILKDKPITYDDSEKNIYIRNSLFEISKAMGRICNLYITNNENKIGYEPFDEWKNNREIPFVYTTKIINPNSEPLNQVIRIYYLTDNHLGSKSFLNRIRDHITERKYNLNSFSIIFLIGDRKKFNNLNTNPITKDLPILDELALKKIIFASETKKKPKWEFTNLLILTKKISDIQPFKSEGSINSEVNIFVGRERIIKEITSFPKDFAIFGGRKIGKSSLLWEINRQLVLKGFKTVICAFQGYSDSINSASMSAANSILRELKVLFGKTDVTSINDLNDFKIQMKLMYNSNINQRVAIFLDEVDELIVREQNLKEHKLIEIFRDISHETNHCWIFIFAGFKKMYLEIKGKGVTYEGLRNPWANFVDSSFNNLIGIDYPESLVNHGLKDILGLEYDSEISKQIVNYSSGHPAFLQYFCQCLVEQIKDKIDHNNRRIYIEDVKAVFEKKDDFIHFVQRTLEMNLSDFQRLLIFIAAEGNLTEFDYNVLEKRLKDWLEVTQKQELIDQNNVRLELELLIITGVIKKSESNKYKFTHEYYLNILKRIEQIDKNVIENLVNKVFSKEENKNAI